MKDTIKRIIKYIGKYRFLLLLTMFISLVTVAGQLIIPRLQGNAIDKIIEAGNVDFGGIFKIIVIILACVVAVAVLQWVMNAINNKITYSIVHDIRKDAFEKLQHLPVKYADSHPTGDVVSAMISDVDQFADGLLMGFTQFFSGVMTILGTLVFMLLINWRIALVVVLMTPLSFLVASFVAKRTYKMFHLQSITRGEQTSFIDEMIGNQKVVQAYSREKASMETFDEINERYRNCSLKAIFFSSLTTPSTRLINNVVYAIVTLVGAFSVISNPLAFTVGKLSSLLSYATQYAKPFNEISGVITELQNSIACAGRILDIIEEKPMDESMTDEVSVEDNGGDVDFDSVEFAYDPAKPLIKDFTLKVQAGQKVAIVGPTGCGKTTVINLLIRFYDVDSGSISLEGKDIRSVTRHSLRKNYGMVLQETWLRYGTIRDNLIIGKPDATEEEIIAAAKASHAHSFIKKLPNGYDTIIGEDGGSLSQGQKQLLCITRVMLCLPPLLILDEATSSIDTRTEVKIQEAFARMMEGRTSFIVAHRLSTIQSADIILVMKDGNIIEHGNHEELLALGGFYKQLYESR